MCPSLQAFTGKWYDAPYMKRRRFVQAVVAAPAASSLLAQQPATSPNNRPAPTSPGAPALNPAVPLSPNPQTPSAAAETPKIETAIADDAAEMNPRFFTAPQFAALRHLSDILMPRIRNAPGALDAHAPEFLDFLIGQSPADRQQVYRAGLDALNGQAKKQFNKTFADLDASQASSLLAPLRQPWTFDPPSDSLAHFLREAKQDVRVATLNSREYSASAGGTGSRRMGGVGLYWYPLD